MSELPDDHQPPLKRPSESKDEPVSAKPKKCRRGKKKKFRKRVGDQQNPDESIDSDGFKIPLPPVNAENKPSVHHPNRKRNRKVLIRPVDVPKAPENSTQFIIDDHDECHLYFNFEKPNPFNSSTDSGKSDNYEDDAAFQDIDYQYESLQDLDNSAYYKQDFETNYFNMRYEEMLGMPRQEIMDTIENMETRILELEEKLYEQDPNLALERLQHKLLQLQEEHSLLSEHNAVLRKALENKEACVDTSSNTSLDEGDDVDVNNHSCEECDSSPGSSQHSDDDEEEESVSGEICSQEDASDLPEYNAQLHITHEHIPGMSDDEDEDAEDNVQYVDDIHILQNNYRAHHISDQSVSHSGDSDHESHGVDDNEGHKVQENESLCTSTVEGYNYVEVNEDSGDDETRVRDIEMRDTQEAESAGQYDADSSECGDIGQSSHYDDQKSEVAGDPMNSDGEEEAIVSSSGITFQEIPDNPPDVTDVYKSGANELEDETNS